MKTKIVVFIVALMSGMLFSSLSYADPVWIDVRTPEEYKVDHIKGDIRITHTDIVADLSEIYPDKSSEIHLYCRSGNRAGKALAALESAGYNNVQNAGSIDDARQIRGITGSPSQ